MRRAIPGLVEPLPARRGRVPSSAHSFWRVPCLGGRRTPKGFPLLTDKPDIARSRTADLSWVNTPDWSAHTAVARRSFEDRFLKMAGGGAKGAAKLRAAHFKSMWLKSAAVRGARKAEGA